MSEVMQSIKNTFGIKDDITATTHTNKYERDEKLASMIAPGTASFDAIRHMEIDGKCRRAYGLRDFSSINIAGWAHMFNKTPGSRCTISVKPSDGETIKKSIDHADARAGVNLVSGGSASKMVDNQLNRDHARTQLQMMADQKKSFLNVSFTYQIEGEDEKEVGGIYRQIRDTSRPKGFSIDPCARAQEQALRDCDPMNTKDDAYLAPRFSIDMPSDTLAASLPFGCGGIIDSGGTELGCDANGSLVRANMLQTAVDRANMNVTLTGASGSGKSRTMKKILMSEYAQGARIIWIDPEQEGKTLCKKLFGQYINAGGNSKVMLCPLQPRMLNFDFDDDDAIKKEDAAVGVLRSTINFLRGFYQLAFLTPTNWLPYLDKALVKAYAKHGLSYDTQYSDIDFEDYPSMDELAKIMFDLSKCEKRENAKKIYDELAEQTLTGSKDGLFGNLWSGETNITLNSDFIVFDINSLTSGNVSTAARNAQMYSILTFVWSEVCRSRVSGKPLRLVVDEAHMLLGCDNDTASDTGASAIAAALLATISRRARKYNCGLMLATQKLSDFTDASVRRHGEALIENSAYQMAFATKNITPVMELMHIPLQQARRLPSYERGRCIFKAGNAMCELHVEDTQSEWEWIGKAGGK